LRAPVEFRRVSSRFASARFHPILGLTRRHDVDRLVERVLLTVDLDPRKAFVAKLLEELPVLTLPVAD
jgi:hypothetical protein